MTSSFRPPESSEEERAGAFAPFAREVGHTRYSVLLPVIAVLLVSMALFVLGAALAGVTVVRAVHTLIQGDLDSTRLTVEFLGIVSVMLKAVVFYLIGVGFYSLFIAPLNVTAALGMETFSDLESKVVSVIIVIMAITFLEHFILWEDPVSMLWQGISLAAVVLSLVAFQWHGHRVKERWLDRRATTQVEARRALFEEDRERAPVRAEPLRRDPPAEEED